MCNANLSKKQNRARKIQFDGGQNLRIGILVLEFALILAVWVHGATARISLVHA